MSSGPSFPDQISDGDMFAQAPGASVGTLDDIREGDGDRDSGIGFDPQGDVEVDTTDPVAADRALIAQQALAALKDPRE